MSGLPPPNVLTYEGQVAVPFIARTFDPTSSNYQFNVPTVWVNTSSETGFILLGKPMNVANWVPIGGGSTVVESLEGNSGGPVPPTGNIIHVVGDGTTVTTVGNPGTSTLTIQAAGSVATTYDEDSGSATPSAGVLNIVGGTGITTQGSGNTVTINAVVVGSPYTNVTHGMSPYTVLNTDYYLSVDCSGGTVTLDFPNAPMAKQVWIVKDRTGNAATNNISISTPGGTVTFDGQTTYTINTNFEAIQLLANATPTYEVF
jgi:hypothetical protein